MGKLQETIWLTFILRFNYWWILINYLFIQSKQQKGCMSLVDSLAAVYDISRILRYISIKKLNIYPDSLNIKVMMRIMIYDKDNEAK